MSNLDPRLQADVEREREAAASARSLKDLSKAELLELAAARELEIPASATKNDLVDLLEAA